MARYLWFMSGALQGKRIARDGGWIRGRGTGPRWTPGASETQVGDLDDVDPLAAYDDLVREHAAREDDVAALRVDAIVAPAVDVQRLGGSHQLVGFSFHPGEEDGG